MIMTRMSITTKNGSEPEIVDLEYYQIKDFFGNMYHAFADSSELTIRDETNNETKKIPIDDIVGMKVIIAKMKEE